MNRSRTGRAAWLLVPTLAACSSRDVADAVPAASHPTGAAEECSSCHPQHFEEWRMSPHAYAMKDPVFQAMVRVGQRETEGKLDDFCVKCHSPIGARTGQTAVRVDDSGNHVQPIEGLDAQAMDGVSCLVCHSMTQVNTRANADFEMELDGVRRATIQDPDPSAPHASEYSSLHADSDLCGACHVVVNPKNVALEETFIEWMQSGFNGAQECQACHMSEYRGRAAVGGRERDVHRHDFVGVDVSLLPEDEFPGFGEMRTRTEELLRRSATFDVAQAPGERRLDVAIGNLAGHALPSGATADREMWVELVVTDGAGAVAFESGTTDERGDLRVVHPERTTRPGSDPALVLYTQEMFLDPRLDDPASTDPVRLVDFLWEPNTETTRIIDTHVTDRRSYDLSTLPAGSYRATARLLFRSFPPHLFRKLEAEGGLDPAVKERVPTVEMAAVTVDLEL